VCSILLYQHTHRLSVTPQFPSLISPSPTTGPVHTIEYNKEVYAYAYIQTTASHLLLLANFANRDDVDTIIQDNACREAVNGGFYDTSHIPLGFFQSEGYTHAYSNNSLLNGLFIVDRDYIPHVTSSPGELNVRFGLQSGPLLMQGENIALLRIRNDEPARRVVVAIDTTNTIIFLVVYASESVFGGPLLADVPEIVRGISQKEHLHLVDAVNLDGGSASAFYSDSVKLSELTPVGSVFCIK
jgi:uncharacterized protein YigE (DUF2233 family)